MNKLSEAMWFPNLVRWKHVKQSRQGHDWRAALKKDASPCKPRQGPWAGAWN